MLCRLSVIVLLLHLASSSNVALWATCSSVTPILNDDSSSSSSNSSSNSSSDFLSGSHGDVGPGPTIFFLNGQTIGNVDLQTTCDVHRTTGCDCRASLFAAADSDGSLTLPQGLGVLGTLSPHVKPMTPLTASIFESLWSVTSGPCTMSIVWLTNITFAILFNTPATPAVLNVSYYYHSQPQAQPANVLQLLEAIQDDSKGSATSRARGVDSLYEEAVCTVAFDPAEEEIMIGVFGEVDPSQRGVGWSLKSVPMTLHIAPPLASGFYFTPKLVSVYSRVAFAVSLAAAASASIMSISGPPTLSVLSAAACQTSNDKQLQNFRVWVPAPWLKQRSNSSSDRNSSDAILSSLYDRKGDVLGATAGVWIAGLISVCGVVIAGAVLRFVIGGSACAAAAIEVPRSAMLHIGILIALVSTTLATSLLSTALLGYGGVATWASMLNGRGLASVLAAVNVSYALLIVVAVTAVYVTYRLRAVVAAASRDFFVENDVQHPLRFSVLVVAGALSTSQFQGSRYVNQTRLWLHFITPYKILEFCLVFLLVAAMDAILTGLQGDASTCVWIHAALGSLWGLSAMGVVAFSPCRNAPDNAVVVTTSFLRSVAYSLIAAFEAGDRQTSILLTLHECAVLLCWMIVVAWTVYRVGQDVVTRVLVALTIRNVWNRDSNLYWKRSVHGPAKDLCQRLSKQSVVAINNSSTEEGYRHPVLSSATHLVNTEQESPSRRSVDFSNGDGGHDEMKDSATDVSHSTKWAAVKDVPAQTIDTLLIDDGDVVVDFEDVLLLGCGTHHHAEPNV